MSAMSAACVLGEIRAVLFDKDGTLFDFHRSWARWAAAFLLELAEGDDERADRLAEAIGFERDAVRFRPGAPFVSGTRDEVGALLLPHLPGWDAARLRALSAARATEARMVPPLPLRPLLAGLRARGLTLGVATNDTELSARMQLADAGVAPMFDLIVGSDCVARPKPAPDMLLRFARAMALEPGTVAMVGDSTHDLHAGRAAGMVTVAVLTGAASRADLEPHADLVLPDVGGLRALLG